MPLPGPPTSQRTISPRQPAGREAGLRHPGPGGIGGNEREPRNRPADQPAGPSAGRHGEKHPPPLPAAGGAAGTQCQAPSASTWSSPCRGLPDCDAVRPVADLFPDRAKPRTRGHPPPSIVPSGALPTSDGHVIVALCARGAGRVLNASRPCQRNRGADFPPRVQSKLPAATIRAGFRRGRLPGARAPGSLRHPIAQDATGPSDPWPPCL